MYYIYTRLFFLWSKPWMCYDPNAAPLSERHVSIMTTDGRKTCGTLSCLHELKLVAHTEQKARGPAAFTYMDRELDCSRAETSRCSDSRAYSVRVSPDSHPHGPPRKNAGTGVFLACQHVEVSLLVATPVTGDWPQTHPANQRLSTTDSGIKQDRKSVV